MDLIKHLLKYDGWRFHTNIDHVYWSDNFGPYMLRGRLSKDGKPEYLIYIIPTNSLMIHEVFNEISVEGLFSSGLWIRQINGIERALEALQEEE